ncbi:PhzF family phenazine biosynthesis protein [Xanthocytophaga agilis]|uniref:PhzF family phenazine biosynthesis protein n=1 Tax=Xanthocytophaga agilis TaxID=3048010 RepID=A0AAE3UG73_9BACT|nr:PhzF family phenazine biosynthesis protein [Xanthocytophaga agilis]MDJ1504105.1 PhzF family phenazine biosynthesis protein [Xanthocytophaga agilis]
MQIPFHIVDVFAEKKYEGNQLAVFEHEGQLNKIQMLAIAKEINFAETTFINRAADSSYGFEVRIFTPDQELPFAGHPTLGTAYIIREEILKQPVAQIMLSLKIGAIPVDFTDNVLWMQQINPSFGQTYSKDEVADFLGLTPDDILSDFPVEEVSTGILFQIVPLRSLAALKSIQVDLAKFLKFLQHYNRHMGSSRMGCMVFTQETYEPDNHISSRMFYPMNNSMVEDAATGSANGCLLAYLLKNQVLSNDSLQIRVEQGYAMSRPSLLYHDGKRLGRDQYTIRIGGKVQKVSHGWWEV